MHRDGMFELIILELRLIQQLPPPLQVCPLAVGPQVNKVPQLRVQRRSVSQKAVRWPPAFWFISFELRFEIVLLLSLIFLSCFFILFLF
jgi:hypothetical protein